MKIKHNEKDKFIIRFDTAEQRGQLKSRAAKNKRTMNSEILFLLDYGIKVVDRNQNASH